MSFRLRAVVLMLLLFAFSATVIPSANAYVDPGTGSMLVSMLIGGAAAVGVAIATFWRRIAGFFTRGRKGAGGVSE